MILRRCLFASSVLMACALIWAGTGCRDEQAPQPPATPAAAHATPEESFEEIVRLIKGGIETKAIGTASGFNIQSEKASSRFRINNVVTSKLIKPTDSTTPYRGTITVTSTSTYSLRHSADDADDKKQDVSPKDNGYNLDQASDADSGFDTMDDKLISAAPADEKPSAESIESVQRRTDTDVRTYELAYQNGQWALMTKLDPETEKSIDNAFKRALSLQP